MQDGDEADQPGESHDDPQATSSLAEGTRINETAADKERSEAAAAHGGAAASAAGYAQGQQPSAAAGEMADEEEIIECPVPGCGAQYRIGAMSNLRSKVCNAHQKMDHFPIDGVDHRYCHQCYKLHPLDEFTGNKRSCTLRLERHNLRRRLNRLYKKSCSSTKDSVPADVEAGSLKPDRNKAAVDLAMQIMSATQEEGSTSKKAASSSSRRAAASKALKVAVSVAKVSAAATSEVAPSVSSSARDHQDDPMGGASEAVMTEGDKVTGFAAGFPGRRHQEATGRMGQLPAYGGIHNTCEVCGGIGCPSCPGMSQASRDYSQGPGGMRPPPRGGAASRIPAEAPQDIDSYLNEYDRYYNAPSERATAGGEAASVSKRGRAAGQMLSPEGLQQPQLQRGATDGRMMPGQPEAGFPPGSDPRRRCHSEMAGPCYACGGFGCPDCRGNRYGQQMQPLVGGRDASVRYPAPEARGGSARPPPAMGAGIRGEGRESPVEQAIGSAYPGTGQAQVRLRTPQGLPVYNISMKLFGNVTPGMLPPDLRDEVLSWLETAPHNLDGYLREGCVHLSIDLTLNTDEDYSSAIQSVPAGFVASVCSAKAKWPWCKCPTTVWLPDQVIHAEEGEIVANAPRCQSNSLELISAEVVTHESIESNKVCRLLSIRSHDLSVPGLKVLLRSPVDGWWRKLAAYFQDTKTLATSVDMHQTYSSRANSKSGSTESEGTCFEDVNGVQAATCSAEVPDHIVQDGLAFVEIVVDGDVGQHRQSRPIAVLLQ